MDTTRAAQVVAALVDIRGTGEPYWLTRREHQCLFLASHGVRPKHAAQVLRISWHTVNGHGDSARLKLAARNTPHAVAIALRAGLIA